MANELLKAWVAYEAVPSKLPVILGMLVLPVTSKLPLTIVLPINVCVSLVASPSWFEPDE